jgi:hypothetical protein
MKNSKTIIFTLFLITLIANTAFSQSSNSHKENKSNNGHHNGSKNKSNDDNYYDDNDRRGKNNKGVKVSDLVGKNPDYVYKELKNRNFIINRHYIDGLTTCKVWRNFSTGQCIKTMSLGKKVYSIENASNCR